MPHDFKTPLMAAALAAGAWAASAETAAFAGGGDQRVIPARGVVRAIDQAQISSDLGARVAKVGFRVGESFKKGELLIGFDCERVRADANAADAVYREMKVTLESNNKLEKFNAIGKDELEISKARVDKAEADAQGLKAKAAQCDVVAPFDGRVAELSINPHEQPPPGKPFLVIVGASRLEIELIVPSKWLGWMKLDDVFEFRIDEIGRPYKAKVARIGASVEAVSQMVKVIGVFDEAAVAVLPGMSGEAVFAAAGG